MTIRGFEAIIGQCNSANVDYYYYFGWCGVAGVA